MIKIFAEQSVPYLEHLCLPYQHLIDLRKLPLSKETIRDADALIVRSITPCNRELLEGSQVQYIATATSGTDHIDSQYLEASKIAWGSSAGCNASSVALYVFASLSHLALQYQFELKGRCIGIIGVGHVGRQVERIALALGMTPLLYDPPRAEAEGRDLFVELEDIQRDCDIITLHVPLLSSTYHLINDDFLARCQKSPILINACRGAVTDTEALLRAKKRGLISHLIIDCWEGEPHINPELLKLSDIATPHIAGFSAEGKYRASSIALLSVSKHFDLGVSEEILHDFKLLGNPPGTVDLRDYPKETQIAQALLTSCKPTEISRKLKTKSISFEILRREYQYPRELSAYTFVTENKQIHSIIEVIQNITRQKS